MIFYGFIDTELKSRNSDAPRNGISEFSCELGTLLSSHPSTLVVERMITCVTCTVTCSTLRVVMDKPSWGPINRETIERILQLIWPLTVLKEFKNSNLENDEFDDRGNAFMEIRYLSVPIGPGWWVDAEGCLERVLKSSRSNLPSKTMLTVISLAFELNRVSELTW